MKVAYLIICLSVLFFVFSCLLSIPPSYIVTAKEQGVTILSALSMMPSMQSSTPHVRAKWATGKYGSPLSKDSLGCAPENPGNKRSKHRAQR